MSVNLLCPGTCAKYCDQHVCMSRCPLTYLKAHVQTARNFLYMLTVAVAWPFCEDNAIYCVQTLLWLTSCFHIMGHISSHLQLWQALSWCPVASLNCGWSLLSCIALFLIRKSTS